MTAHRPRADSSSPSTRAAPGLGSRRAQCPTPSSHRSEVERGQAPRDDDLVEIQRRGYGRTTHRPMRRSALSRPRWVRRSVRILSRPPGRSPTRQASPSEASAQALWHVYSRASGRIAQALTSSAHDVVRGCAPRSERLREHCRAPSFQLCRLLPSGRVSTLPSREGLSAGLRDVGDRG